MAYNQTKSNLDAELDAYHKRNSNTDTVQISVPKTEVSKVLEVLKKDDTDDWSKVLKIFEEPKPSSDSSRPKLKINVVKRMIQGNTSNDPVNTGYNDDRRYSGASRYSDTGTYTGSATIGTTEYSSRTRYDPVAAGYSIAGAGSSSGYSGAGGAGYSAAGGSGYSGASASSGYSAVYDPVRNGYIFSDFDSISRSDDQNSKKIVDVIKDKFKDRDHIMCLDLLQSGKCNARNCKFEHKIHHTFKSIICIGWKQGNCNFEAIKCRHSHGFHDPNSQIIQDRQERIIDRIDKAARSIRERSRSRERYSSARY